MRAILLMIGVCPIPSQALAGDNWIELTGKPELTAWKSPSADWIHGGDARLDPKNPRKLIADPGNGVLVNGPKGGTRDLVTREEFADAEVHVEFMIPKGSNSGVKMMGLYEIQIVDTFGRRDLTGDSLGGIYPRAELTPKYRYLDDGVPPRVNAAKPAGEWQTLDIVFRAPRLNEKGMKTEDARFVKVTLNGQVIHENVTVKNPTGHAWTQKEPARGPLLLQADHGPVAFRNVRIRPVK